MSDCIEWSGFKDQCGYGMVKWKGKTHRVHRFVFGLYHNYLPPVVRHSCDNPACYNLEHLLGGTQLDNMRDCIERGRFGRNDGEHNPRAKLSVADVHAIRARLQTGESQASIARSYGVDNKTINRIALGERWKNV